MAKKKPQTKRRLRHGESGNLLGRSDETSDALGKVMFDPGDQHLDLTKAEKLRTTALLMAINYVKETIVNDAEMYRALRQDGKELVPASVPWVLQCSVDFELFLLGYYTRHNVAMVKRGAEAEARRAQSTEGNGAAATEPTERPETADAVARPDPNEQEPTPRA